MDLLQALEIIAKYWPELDADRYDGVIVKKLEASNTLDDGRSTNQTHIAITGEQMDIFPYIYSEKYMGASYDNRDDGMKKYFILQAPAVLYKSNVCRWATADELKNMGLSTDAEVVTHISVVRSRRRGQADQVQLSMINSDGKEFVAFRKTLHTGDYLIILKCKGEFKYDCLGIKNEEENNLDELEALNNKFIFTVETTPVEIDKITGTAKGGFNKIYYGAPGCGKSHYVSSLLKNAGVNDADIFRVTFHPEYMNCDFVGQVLPFVEEKTDPVTGEKKETVKYRFAPGPFTLALRRAYSTGNMVYLVIEEINRGNAAAIFGDLFQLLDRIKDTGAAGFSESEYPIRNPNIQDYIISKDGIEILVETERINNGIFIPGNLTILATMNSSDQNVFTLDTAFKRRWQFEQISNDIEKDTEHAYKGWYIPGTSVTWETFLTRLNDRILDYKIHNQTNEDKRLGKYFVTRECLTETPLDIVDVRDRANDFAYKVLEYIWNDVCKIGREEWFDTGRNRTLEDLIENFVYPDTGKSPLDVFQNITF